jgi:CRP-like cAMP-binding protein
MSENQALWYLENIDMTGIFCPKKLGRGDLEKHAQKTYKKGEYIFLPEEHSDRVYFITEGRVKMGTYSDTGKEVTKVILHAGEVFGELALVGEGKRRDFAFAMDDTRVCILSVQDMRSLMREYNALSLFIMKLLAGRVVEMEQRLESLIFKDSRTRIVEFLHELAEKKGRRVGFEREVRRFMTHQDIANLTATSRQTVTTVLNELRNKNVLTFNRKRLLVRDMDRLAAEA